MSHEVPIRKKEVLTRQGKYPVRPEEILIRQAAADDAPALLAIYAPYVRKTAITFEYEVPTEDKFRGRIGRTLKRFPCLVAYRKAAAGAEKQSAAGAEEQPAACAEEQPASGADRQNAADRSPESSMEEYEILGYAYAGYFKTRAAYDWACEVSIYVREDMKRSGTGRRLYEALELCLAAMGMRNLYACIGVPEADDEYLNHDSVRFHERMGYRLCGTFRRCGYKFGRWYDMCWMEKFLVPQETEVKPVVPFPEICEETDPWI